MNFKNISNDNLLANIKKLSMDERKITAEILHHLREIEFRRLHLKIGYSSLFEYAVKELGYSEGSAYRRINAMRLLKTVPEVENKINTGALTLEGAAKIQKYISSQKKIEQERKVQPKLAITPPSHKLETKAQKLEFIESLEHKSLKEIDKAIVKINPLSLQEEKIRQIDDDKVELKLVIDEDLKKELDLLKNLLAHKNPNMSYRDLIKYLTQLGIKKFDLSKKVVVAPGSSTKNQRDVSPQRRRPASENSRNIPSAVKQEVYMRDKGCCSYTDPKTKRRCNSRHLLQYDHKLPYSFGGKSSIENLRLLCFQHHKYITENAQRIGLGVRAKS